MVHYQILTPEMREHFLEHGYVKIEGAIPRANIERFTNNVWTRLGWKADDQSTWVDEGVHMPRHREVLTKEFMPKAYLAACELIGGEDKLDKTLFTQSGDSLIVNVGSEHWRENEQHPRDTGNWHIDGDWFTHHLDSGDQALVVICLFTDVQPRGGPTLVCPAAIPAVCKWLYNHPEGGWDNKACFDEALKDIEEYEYLTGKAGDVFLAHPFMPHSKSPNHKRIFRAITNPPMTLKEPLKLYRPDGDYSLVEQKILKSLGKSSLPEWHVTGPRERWHPTTAPGKQARVQGELARMLEESKKTGEVVDSVHLRGETLEQDRQLK